MKNLLARKHYDRARQFEMQDHVVPAVEAYEAAVALEPDFPDAYFRLGRIEATRGKNERALELLGAAVERGADHQAVEWRAYVLGRMRRFDEALEAYREVLDEGDGQVRVNVGRMLLALRRYDEAAEVLSVSDEPSAKVLTGALPRYREYDGTDRTDDGRAVRYLFGRTLVLGTAGDGSQVVAGARYLLLTPRHIAVTVGRFEAVADARGWVFDAVAGEGPHHGPVARALAELLEVPLVTVDTVEEGARVLLCSAVVSGSDSAKALRAPWAKARVMHLALGFVPIGDPSPDEPHLVGFVNRCAVPWYRVEDYARLVADEDGDAGRFPGFKVGPAYVDPNEARVATELVTACNDGVSDPLVDSVVAYFVERHVGSRAFEWEDA